VPDEIWNMRSRVPTVTMRIAAMVVIGFLKKSIELMVVGSIVNEFFSGSIQLCFHSL
jgi:hypothetical protein